MAGSMKHPNNSVGDLDVKENGSSHDAQPVDGVVLTPAIARRLVVKTDMVIMPLIIVCMTLAFLDKVRNLPPRWLSRDEIRSLDSGCALCVS